MNPSDHVTAPSSKYFLPAIPPDLPARPPDDSCRTVLEAPETNVPRAERQTDWGMLLTSSDPSVLFRHSGWSRTRQLVRTALADSYLSPRSLERFDLCGSDPWVAVDPEDPNRLTILTNTCRNRWCLPCAQTRSAVISQNLARRLGAEPIRFLTLTLKHRDSSLSSQLQLLYDSFRRLRRAEFWSRCVDGGAAVLEVKHSHTGDTWHVHLHVLFQGKYLPHLLVSREWLRITGDSFIVHVKLIHRAENAARYVAKYCSKPVPSTVVNKPHVLLELVTALRGRRLVLTFGLWRGFRLLEKLDATEWHSLVPLEVLYERLKWNDPAALELISALERIRPDARNLLPRDSPRPPTPKEESAAAQRG